MCNVFPVSHAMLLRRAVSRFDEHLAGGPAPPLLGPVPAGVGAVLLGHEPVPVSAAAGVLEGAALSALGVEIPPEKYEFCQIHLKDKVLQNIYILMV